MENGQSVNGTAVLQQKLNDPNTVAALTRLLDRIDSLEQTVNTLATTIEHALTWSAWSPTWRMKPTSKRRLRVWILKLA